MAFAKKLANFDSGNFKDVFGTQFRQCYEIAKIGSPIVILKMYVSPWQKGPAFLAGKVRLFTTSKRTKIIVACQQNGASRITSTSNFEFLREQVLFIEYVEWFILDTKFVSVCKMVVRYKPG